MVFVRDCNVLNVLSRLSTSSFNKIGSRINGLFGSDDDII